MFAKLSLSNVIIFLKSSNYMFTVKYRQRCIWAATVSVLVREMLETVKFLKKFPPFEFLPSTISYMYCCFFPCLLGLRVN